MTHRLTPQTHIHLEHEKFETTYKKLWLPPVGNIVFNDIVSLFYAFWCVCNNVHVVFLKVEQFCGKPKTKNNKANQTIINKLALSFNRKCFVIMFLLSPVLYSSILFFLLCVILILMYNKEIQGKVKIFYFKVVKQFIVDVYYT